MDLDLTNKSAVVCGSTRGIGKAAALELAHLGAHVILVSRDEDALVRTQKELPRSGTQHHDHIQADFAQPHVLKEKIGHYAGHHPPVHILVNNTGGPPGGPITGAGSDEFVDVFSRHLLCNHILVQALLPGMKALHYGRIINVISISVKQPIAGLGVSNTVRGAVASWAKTLAGEVAPFGITVNNILPGTTRTARLEWLMQERAKRQNASVETVSEEMIAEVPAGRFGDPADIANAIAFLASPAASYINGINLPVDGGRLACL